MTLKINFKGVTKKDVNQDENEIEKGGQAN